MKRVVPYLDPRRRGAVVGEATGVPSPLAGSRQLQKRQGLNSPSWRQVRA